MKKGFSYFAPLQKSNNMQFDGSSWKKATKLYEKKEFKKSMLEVLKYANRKINKFKISDNVYKIPHGSIFVDIDFSGEEIRIGADFLNVKNANKIPLYRNVAEINFSGLNLSQIKLNGDELKFDFSCPIELFEPYKIFDVLAEICYFSDKYDEEFSEKFGAEPISEGKIIELSDSVKNKVYNNFKSILKESFEFIEYLENKRQNYYVWDVLSITIKRISTSCNVQGSLAVRISEEVGNLYSKEDSIQNIIYKAKEFLKELDEMKQEDFTKNLYITDEFIPNRKVATEENISEYLKPGYTDAVSDLQSGNIMGSYLIFTHCLYNSLHYHIMPSGMEKAVRKTLKMYSNMKIEKPQTSNLSLSTLSLINLENIPASHRGFFGILWAMIIGLIMFVFGN